MTFISYAQNFEDVLLWRALKDVKNGFYIDIGANDPEIDSISKGFYEKGWRGVHVEPTPSYAQKLRQARPDEIIKQVAIGNDINSTIIFYEFPDTGLSTASQSIAQKHIDAGFRVNVIQVPIISLDLLLQKYENQTIHWLKIDVEGLEEEVITSWKNSTNLPWLLVIESTEPLSQSNTHQKWEYLIFSKKYEFVHFDGLNRYYLAPHKLDLKNTFSIQPNYFDNFLLSPKHYLCKLANPEFTELREQITTLNTQLSQSHLENTLLRNEINNLRNSISWRITKPLRIIRKTLGKF